MAARRTEEGENVLVRELEEQHRHLNILKTRCDRNRNKEILSNAIRDVEKRLRILRFIKNLKSRMSQHQSDPNTGVEDQDFKILKNLVIAYYESSQLKIFTKILKAKRDYYYGRQLDSVVGGEDKKRFKRLVTLYDEDVLPNVDYVLRSARERAKSLVVHLAAARCCDKQLKEETRDAFIKYSQHERMRALLSEALTAEEISQIVGWGKELVLPTVSDSEETILYFLADEKVGSLLHTIKKSSFFVDAAPAPFFELYQPMAQKAKTLGQWLGIQQNQIIKFIRPPLGLLLDTVSRLANRGFRDILRGIVRQLETIHGHNVAHGNLNEANILVNDKLKVKLTNGHYTTVDIEVDFRALEILIYDIFNSRNMMMPLDLKHFYYVLGNNKRQSPKLIYKHPCLLESPYRAMYFRDKVAVRYKYDKQIKLYLNNDAQTIPRDIVTNWLQKIQLSPILTQFYHSNFGLYKIDCMAPLLFSRDGDFHLHDELPGRTVEYVEELLYFLAPDYFAYFFSSCFAMLEINDMLPC